MSKPKILIIDDELDILEIYKIQFEKNGFEVCIEPDGLKGVMKAVEFMPDVVLLDIMMPGMDGFKTLDAFRNCTSMNVVIIVFSNFSHGYQDVQKLITMGADECIIKSDFTPPDLVKKVKIIIDNHRA